MLPPKGRISLKTIAEEVGVSVATVSLALRGTGKMRESTRKEVQETAERLGYRPDPLLASLATSRFREDAYSHQISLAYIKLNAPGYWGHQLEEDAREKAQHLGYQIDFFTCGAPQEVTKLTSVLYHRGFRGIILSQSPLITQMPEGEWARFAIAGTNRPFFSPHYPVARSAIFEPIRDLVIDLCLRGYTRIGFYLEEHQPLHCDDEIRLSAALFCAEVYDVELSIFRSIFHHPFDLQFRRAQKWLTLNRPEVVIATTPGPYFVLKQLAKVDPALSCDFITLREGGKPSPEKLSGYPLPHQDLAAVELVNEQLLHGRLGLGYGDREVLVHPSWYEGETLSRPPQKSGSPLQKRHEPS